MRYTTTGQRAMTDGDKDYRYTIRIYLIRDERPKYWEFHCPKCGQKICEVNGEMVYLTDVTHDGNNTVRQANRMRCNGRYCGWWFEFSMK